MNNQINETHLSLEGSCILAIDQNKIGQYILQKYLRKWHTTFEIAGNLQYALRQLQSQHFDLVLLNIERFDSSWRESIQKIKSCGSIYPPIIGLTPLLDDHLRNEAASLGLRAILETPIEPGLFIKTVEHHLNQLGSVPAQL